MTIDVKHWLDRNLSSDERWQRHDEIMRDIETSTEHLETGWNQPAEELRGAENE